MWTFNLKKDFLYLKLFLALRLSQMYLMTMSHLLIFTSVFEVIRLEIFVLQISNNEPSLGKSFEHEMFRQHHQGQGHFTLQALTAPAGERGREGGGVSLLLG